MEYQVVAQSFVIGSGQSKSAPSHGLIISVRKSSFDSAVLVIGGAGLPNVIRKLELGDAVLYETPEQGLAEVRVTRLGHSDIEVLVTRVAPRLGLSGGVAGDDIQNSPFAIDEVARIRESLSKIVPVLAARADVSPEQLDYLSRKLDEIAAASERLGRKDWIMFAAGTLTNVIVGAAFSPEVAKAMFTTTNGALSWVFQNALRFLST